MRRYPLDPLFAAMGMTPNQACIRLGVSGSTQQDYRRRGVTDAVAESLATKAGFHPYEVWPELADDRYAEMHRPCEECGEMYVPNRSFQKYCGKACRERQASKRWLSKAYSDPVYAERRRQESAEYYASLTPRVKAARYARQQELRRARRDEVNAAARRRYHERKARIPAARRSA